MCELFVSPLSSLPPILSSVSCTILLPLLALFSPPTPPPCCPLYLPFLLFHPSLSHFLASVWKCKDKTKMGGGEEDDEEGLEQEQNWNMYRERDPPYVLPGGEPYN